MNPLIKHSNSPLSNLQEHLAKSFEALNECLHEQAKEVFYADVIVSEVRPMAVVDLTTRAFVSFQGPDMDGGAVVSQSLATMLVARFPKVGQRVRITVSLLEE